MPARKGPKDQLLVRIPIELRARLDLLLVSELEGRVPYGMYSAFVSDRIREFLEWEGLDLSPYGFREGFFVRGPKEMVRALREVLETTGE